MAQRIILQPNPRTYYPTENGLTWTAGQVIEVDRNKAGALSKITLEGVNSPFNLRRIVGNTFGSLDLWLELDQNRFWLERLGERFRAQVNTDVEDPHKICCYNFTHPDEPGKGCYKIFGRVIGSEYYRHPTKCKGCDGCGDEGLYAKVYVNEVELVHRNPLIKIANERSWLQTENQCFEGWMTSISPRRFQRVDISGNIKEIFPYTRE